MVSSYYPYHPHRTLVFTPFYQPLFTPPTRTPTPPTNQHTRPIMGIELSKVQTGLLIGIVLMTGFFSMVCQYFWKGGDDQLKPDYNPERARPFVPRKGYSTNPLIDYLQLQEDKIAKREGIPILPDNQGLPAVLQRGVKGEFPWPMPTFHPKDERSLSTKRYQKRMREMGRL